METQPAIKDYLGFENARNKENAALFEALIRRAFGEGIAVLVGHHLTFERDGQLDTENEVPSADTLLFDHDIMGRVFGTRAPSIMMHLASVPCGERDKLAARYLAAEGQLPDHPTIGMPATSEYPAWVVDDAALSNGRM